MENRIKTYPEFYRYYLTEHSNYTCRLLHIVGTTIVLALLLTAIIHLNAYWLIFVPLSGYGFAWFGHYIFEKNQPATFKYPLWSLISDFKMYFEVLSGKLHLDSSKDNL